MHDETRSRLHYPLFVLFILLMLLGAILLGRIVKDFFSDADIILTSFSYLSPGGAIHFPVIFLFRFFNVAVALTALGYVGAASLEQARMRDPREHARLIRLCGVNVAWAAAFAALFFLLWLPALLHMPALRAVVYGEDGAVEWAQVALLAATVCLLAVSLVRAIRASCPWYLAALLGMVILGCVFVIGEELDWGQRLFGWTSSLLFAQRNLKGQMNLHGMLDRGTLVFVYTLSAFLFSVLVPFSAWLRTRLGPDSPLARILPGGRWIFVAVLMPAIFQYDEFYELVVTIILFAYALRQQRYGAARDCGRRALH